MKIEQRNITVRDLHAGYENRENEEGVVGFGGALNIRPAYQREFVYDGKQRDQVVHTVRKGFPLNVMYWAKNPDGGFEVLDGQQRTISICEYVENNFSIDFGDGHPRTFHNLTKDQQDQILEYELLVYVCEGPESEKLDWFKIINIASEELTEQELRNAVYTGPWLADAKRHFSRTGCPAYGMGSKLLKGSAIRQDYLETVLGWINDGKIDQYMSDHQHDPNASALWGYFNAVVVWVNSIFGKHYRPQMKGVNWGKLYNDHHKQLFDTAAIEAEVLRLMKDDEVTNKSGIYPFVFTQDQKWLNLRGFSENQRIEAHARQGGVCPACAQEGEAKVYAISDMDADHITPWSEGGRTDADNCQMLCKRHNRSKGSR